MNQDFNVKKSNICLKKKIVERGSPEKKFLHKQWAKNKIVQADNSPKREKGFCPPEKANYFL